MATEKVIQTHEKIQEMLEHLDNLQNSILYQHEKDFLAAYKDHMLKVEVELVLFKKRTADFYLKMKKDERLSFLE